MKKILSYGLLISAAALAAGSCGTSGKLAEGQYILSESRINVDCDDKSFRADLVSPYIKQKPDNSIITKVFGSLAGRKPVIFKEDAVATSVSNMERQMEYLGYYNSSIEASVKKEGRKARVTYNVKPGRRYTIEKIDFDLPDNNAVREDFFRDTANLSIHPGDFLSLAALENETVRSSAFFRDNGWYGFNKNMYTFEADTIGREAGAALTMKIRQPEDEDGRPQELLKYRFGKVSISRPSTFPFRNSTLKTINTIRPGKPYSESTINNTYSRFSSLGAISGVTITLNPADTPGRVDCNIDLVPAMQRGFKLNLETSSNSNGLIGLSPELTYTNRNVFHGGETLNLSFSGDFQFKPGTDIRSREFGVSAAIGLPRFMLLPTSLFKSRIPTTQIKASYNYQNRPEYERNIISTSYTYLGSSGRFHYQISPLNINIVKLYNIDESFYRSLANNPFLRNAYRNHLDVGAGATILYTTDASIVPKGSYHYLRLNMDISGNILSAFKPLMRRNNDGAGLIWNTPFSQYVRAELTLGRTWALGEKHSLAGRILLGAGYAYGNSTALPFEKHFYSGGANSLRGWQARSIGPGFSKENENFVIPSQTGDMRFEANLEYRFRIISLLSGALFTDVGNIWTLKNDEDNPEGRFRMKDFARSLAADWGFGLRLDFSVLLVRFDMGIKMRDPSRDEGGYWVPVKEWLSRDGFTLHLGVGFPF